jgi:hypothetical protein
LIDLKSTKYRLMYGKIENHNSAYQPKFMWWNMKIILIKPYGMQIVSCLNLLTSLDIVI